MRPGSRHWVSDLIFGLKKFRRLRNERNYRSRTQKRSGIPIAPSGTESAAGRDNAKRPTPSPMRRDCCGHGERFPRKDPGVFDLLGSSLSCDTAGLTPLISICTYGLPNHLERHLVTTRRQTLEVFTPMSSRSLLDDATHSPFS